MIKYDKLWETMKSKGITQYDLYTRYHMNRSQLNRLKHDKNVEVNTIDKLWCGIKKLTAYSQGFHNKTKRIRRYLKWHVNMTMNTKYRQ